MEAYNITGSVSQHSNPHAKAFCHATHAKCVPKCFCKRPRCRTDVASDARRQRTDGYGDVFEVNAVGDKGYDDVGYLRSPNNPFGDLKSRLLNLVDY